MKRFCVVIFGFGLLLVGVVPALHLAAISIDTPSWTEFKKGVSSSDRLLLDRFGEPLQSVRKNFERRRLTWTPLARISPAMLSQVIWSEDRRFYQHDGVDWFAVISATTSPLRGKKTRGASTISMQAARLIFQKDLFPRSVLGKVRQIKYGVALEQSWTKPEILESYLNLVTFRGELQGIAAASWGLFQREPAALTEEESAILVAALRSPNSSSDLWANRACVVYRRGRDLPCAGIQTIVHEISTRPPSIPKSVDLAPHLARKLLTPSVDENTLRTTVDSRVQRKVLEVLKTTVANLSSNRVRDGAALVVDNRSGEILAYVGNTGARASRFYVDGVLAKRESGSTLKPFIYGIAFERNILRPETLLDDSPADLALPSGVYDPRNYDRKYHGVVPAAMALGSSLNIPAVRVLDLIGVESFHRTLTKLEVADLKRPDSYGLSAALGSVSVNLWELAQAYAGLARGGELVELTSASGSAPRTVRRIFSNDVACAISNILSNRENRALTFGFESPLATRYWSAVKTGTSRNMTDNWCVGYSSDYTVAVWIGNFSGESMLNVSGVTGAAPAWVEIMNYLNDNRSVQKSQNPCAGYESNSARGIEVAEVSRGAVQIAYPPEGLVIALDPDIPSGRQRLRIQVQNDGSNIGVNVDSSEVQRESSGSYYWNPEPGTHKISLKNVDTGQVISTRTVMVRGSLPK